MFLTDTTILNENLSDAGMPGSLPVFLQTDTLVPQQTNINPVTNQPGTISTQTNAEITGAIFDQKNNPLFEVTITMIDETGSPIGQSIQLSNQSNTYDVWTYRPDQISVLFQKPGYKDFLIDFNSLQQNPNVVLQSQTKSFKIVYLIAVFAVIAFIKANKKKRISGKTNQTIQTALLIGGGLIGFTLIKKLLEKFGIWDGPGTKAAQNENANPDSAFNPAFWKKYIGKFTFVIDNATAQSYANKIQNSFHLFYDDYESILGVFQQLQTKSNVSYLADVFQQNYNQSLLAFLQTGGGILPWDGLSETHLQTIINYVNNLRDY